MSYPPIFAVCAASEYVQAALGTNPVRLFLFGEAPQNVAAPYAVWQTIGGSPDNYLGNVPDVDRYSIQIDVYANSANDARNAVLSLRDAIEPVAYITGWRGEVRDPETKKYRSSFDVDWIVKRQ